MARMRRSAGVEARAARTHAVSGLLAGLLAAAVWITITRYLPADWTWPTAADRDRIVLIGGGGLLALGAFRCGAVRQPSTASGGFVLGIGNGCSATRARPTSCHPSGTTSSRSREHPSSGSG